MLNASPVAATIAVRDLDRARQFYSDTLGLKVAQDFSPGALVFESGGASLMVYWRPTHEPSAATVATFTVTGLEDIVAELESKGATFQVIDQPGLKTGPNHIAESEEGPKMAWITDPEGNIIGLGELD